VDGNVETTIVVLLLWRDADRDVPILKQAKAEFAKLQ
jgi:hypothetical protein